MLGGRRYSKIKNFEIWFEIFQKSEKLFQALSGGHEFLKLPNKFLKFKSLKTKSKIYCIIFF